TSGICGGAVAMTYSEVTTAFIVPLQRWPSKAQLTSTIQPLRMLSASEWHPTLSIATRAIRRTAAPDRVTTHEREVTEILLPKVNAMRRHPLLSILRASLLECEFDRGRLG